MAAEADVTVPLCETRGEQVGTFVDNIINISVSKLSQEKHTRDDQFNEQPTVEGEIFLRPPSASEVGREVEAAADEEITAAGIHQNGTDSSVVTSDDATDHGIRSLAEKSEETSLVQVKDAQIECNEHLKEESERLPLTDVSMGNNNDSIPPATHNVKDKDEDLIEAESSENEPSTICLSVSNLSQENTIEAEDATVDAGERHKESLESCLPIASSSPKEGSTSAVLQDVTSEHSEALENLSVGEAHTETNNAAPDISDDQKVEFAANEEISVEDIQPNAEESNSTEEDGEGGVVPEQCSTASSVVTSEVKAGDTVDDPDVDDARVVTQLSKDTSIENIALTKEILEETNIPSEETEPLTPCSKEGEELIVQVKTTGIKSEGEKTAEEDVSCDLTSEVSKEGESDQNKTASEQEVLENDTSVGDDSNTAAGEASLDDSTSKETTTTLELQSESESYSSLSKGNMSLIAEKSQESSLVQIEDSKIDSDEQLEEDGESLPLTEASTRATNDNVSPVTEIASKETTTTLTLQSESESYSSLSKEEKGGRLLTAEKLEESSLVPTEESKIECDEHLEQEGESLPLTEVSTGATNDVPDIAYKETATTLELQSESESNSTLSKEEETRVEKSDKSLTSDESSLAQIEDSKIECDEHLEEGEKLPFTEVSTGAKETTTLELQSESESNSSPSKEEETTVERSDSSLTTEKSGESSLVQTEDSKIDFEEQLEEEGEILPLADVSTVATNDNVPPVTYITSKETTTTLELQSKNESNSSLPREEETTVEKGNRSLIAEKSEESSLVQIEDSKTDCDEQLEEEGEKLHLTEVSTGPTNDNITPVTDIVEHKDEDLTQVELFENELGTMNEDKQIETHAKSLFAAPEDIDVLNLSQENNIKELPQEQITDATLHEDINEVEEATIDEVDQQKECLESLTSTVSSPPDEGSMNAVLQEVTSDRTDEKTFDKVDKPAEVLENLTIDEARSEINNFAPDISEVTEKPDQTVTDDSGTLLLNPKLDDQRVESAVGEEISVEEIQQNVEELNNTTKDGDGGVVPEQCSSDSLLATSEVKAGETLDNLDVDDSRVATQLSKDISSDEHDANDCFTKDISHAKEILDETNIPIKDTASQAPSLAEGEEMNVQVKTTDNKSEDEKTTEEDKSCTLTNEVSEEGESDQIKTTSEQVSTSEISVDDDSNTAGEEVSQENNASAESITTLETRESNELQRDINFISSFSKEDETTERGDRSVTASEECGVPLESSGDIEWQSKTSENAAIDHSESEIVEKSEESSLLDSDNVSEAIDKAKDEDEELKKIELLENEQSIEHPAESLHVAPEFIEISDLHQENIKGPPEEQNTDADMHGNTIEADEATVNDVVDQQNESLESHSTAISTEDAEGNPLIKGDGSENQNEDDIGKESEKVPDFSRGIETAAIEDQDLSTHPQEIMEKRSDREIVDESETKEDPLENFSSEVSDKDLLIEEDTTPTDDVSAVLLEPRTANECLSTIELPNDENSTDCTKLNKENLQDAPEDHKASTSSEATETTLSLEEQSLAENSQKIIGNSIIEAADKKELSLENVATEIPYEYIEREDPVEKGDQYASLTEATIEETNARDSESRKIEEADMEKPVDSLQVETEDIKQHDSNLDINNSVEEQIQDNTEREPVDSVDTNEELLEEKGIEKNNQDCDKDGASNEVSTKNTEGGLIKEEESIELETNIEPPLVGQDRETSYLDEEISTANTDGVMDDNKEDIADNANGSEDETINDKENTGNTTTLHEDQEDCSRLEKNEDLGNDSENTPSTEAPEVYTTESSPVKEEEQVENSVEDEIITANPQETCNKTQEKIVDAADENEDVVVNVPIGEKEDGSEKPASEEALAERIDDVEPTVVHEASSANEKTVKANLFEEEKNIENALANEGVATSSVQDREASYLEEQASTTYSQETIQLADEKEEIIEDKNDAPYVDTIEESLIQADGSLLEQKEHSEVDNESSTSTADALKDTITESISVREVAQVEDPIESSKVTTEDIKDFVSCEDAEISSTEKEIQDPEDISSNKITEKTIEETSKETQEAQDIAKSVPYEEVSPNVEDGSQEACLVEGSVGIIDEHESTTSQGEQILSADHRELIDDNKDNKIVDPIDFQKETLADEVPKEIESVDVKTTSIELEEEQGDLKDIQMATAVNLVADNQEKSSNLTAEKKPSAEDLDVNEDIIGHIPAVENDRQQEPSIMEVSEEHVQTSDEHVSDSNRLEPEVLESNNDQVVGEANSCGDKTDSEKIEVPFDGHIAVPTTLAEIDHKQVNETLLHDASEYVSESDEVNGEEKTDSNNCNEVSGSNTSVASQEVSTSNVAIEEDSTGNYFQEPKKETREETETEEPQKQDSEPQVSELIQNSTVENIERDAQPFLASANDSGITEEVKKLQEVPLAASEENTTTDCKESDVVENIDHPEQNDTTKCLSDDKKPYAEALEETVANDILPVPLSETSEVDHSTTERELTNREEPSTENTATVDDEKEASEEKISDISSSAPDLIHARDLDVTKLSDNYDNVTEVSMINGNTSVECILVNERSVTDLEIQNDDEAPEIKETTPSYAEGQDVEENSNTPGSLTEEKSDSDEVAPGENKTGYESSNHMLEPNAHVQSRDIISEIEEDNLKAEADIKSVKAVAGDALEQDETTCENEIMKDDITSEKEQLLRSTTDDEDIKDFDQCSFEEEVIRDSHQEYEVKQEQQKISNETVEFIKDGSHTETVSKAFEEAEDEASEDREEKVLTNEAIDKIFHQEEQEKNTEEPATESEEQNNKDEICSSGETQARDEEEIMLSEGKNKEIVKETDTWTKPNEDEEQEAYVEAKKLDFASQTEGISECTVIDGAHNPEDNEDSTIKSTIVDVSSASENIALIEQATEATIATAEVHEEKATGIESREVEEVNDKCAEMEDTSTPVEPPLISTSKIIPEWTVGTPLEVEDQQTEVQDLPEELNFKDSEEQMAEKDGVVNLQSARDISKDVQELTEESFEVSNNENPVEGGPEEKTETSEGQETKPVQNAHVSETLEEETEEQQPEKGNEDVHEEQEKIKSIPNQLESIYGEEPNISQTTVEDTAQHEKIEGRQQIDSPPSLPQVQCSVIKTSEKDLLVHVSGLDNVDVAELEASPLPLKDNQVVLEADDAKNLNHENQGGDKNISTEFSQDEHEIEKPSKVEQEEAECENEERTEQQRERNPGQEETGKPSLSELFEVSTRGPAQMADHSATQKEPTSHTKDLRAENIDEAEHENSKTDEEKDDEEESHEQQRSDSVSEAPVMVDMGDADVKVAHKKSHNILSGVGSKVKHSIAKVKKAIIGKSSHPKPPSPKKVTN